MEVPRIAWITGIPSSGKTTLALALYERLTARGVAAARLDGDELRAGPSRDLGFGREARRLSARRASALAVAAGAQARVVLVAHVSPYAEDRAEARATTAAAGLLFVEVFMDTALDECRRRDAKGLYAAAAGGRLTGLTGWDAPYERPGAPEVHLRSPMTIEAAGDAVLDALSMRPAERR